MAERKMMVRTLLIVIGAAGLIVSPALSPVLAAPGDDAGAPGTAARGSIDAGGQSRADSGNPLWAIPLRTLSTTRERPVFSPSRRPPPPAVVSSPVVPYRPPPPPPQAERPQLSLIGTVLGGEEDIGIFLDKSNKKVVRLRAGDNIGGWVLTAVRGKEATLTKSNETMLVAFPAPDPRGSADRQFPGGPLKP